MALGQNTPAAAPNQAQLNALQRAAVLAQAVEMKQLVFSQTIDPTKQTVVNIQPRNVGLIKKFIVKVTATATNTDGALDLAVTDFGVANLLSQVSFTDLNNNVRIQTSGWHLAFVAAAKLRAALGLVFSDVAASASSVYGDIFNCIKAPATIAHGTAGTVQMIYEVPLAYSDDDLRGAVYANVVNAVMNLQVTINSPGFFAAANTDSTLAGYIGTVTAALSNVKIDVYQVYLDQLPVGNKGIILPMLDLATVYELKNTSFTAIAAGNDFPIPYANFRDFLSTCAVYNHDPSANAGRVGGTDVNYWALQSANFTNIWKIDPVIAALEVRKMIGMDLPKGAYYFESRKKPISTTTYGNMELILNASSAAAGAYALIGWEDFALTNTLTAAGSLAAAGN